jgi:hypothetical protein
LSASINVSYRTFVTLRANSIALASAYVDHRGTIPYMSSEVFVGAVGGVLQSAACSLTGSTKFFITEYVVGSGGVTIDVSSDHSYFPTFRYEAIGLVSFTGDHAVHPGFSTLVETVFTPQHIDGLSNEAGKRLNTLNAIVIERRRIRKGK